MTCKINIDVEEQLEMLLDNPINIIESIEKEVHVPLFSPWTFWLDKAMRGNSVEQYTANLKVLCKVKTVQEFWGVINHIPKVSDINSRYSYHLMRDDRRPVWEDKENKTAGNWTFKCQKKDTASVWKEIILATIGEQLGDSVAKGDTICGVSVSIRNYEDLIQLWNSDASLSDDATVEQAVKALVPDVKFKTIYYKSIAAHM